jgi:hypothetical protein
MLLLLSLTAGGFDSNRACAPLKAENEIIKLNIDEKLN